VSRLPAPHVQAALGRAVGGPAAQSPPAGPAGSATRVGAVQAQGAAAAVDRFAPHVQAAIRFEGRKAGAPQGQAGRAAPDDYVLYVEKKLGGSPPPPPRRPVYALGCDDKGRGCSLQSLETGRVVPAGDVYAGFVRMVKGGPVYVSPRAGVGLQGDSHPSIASRTPEWTRGQRALAAAGEVGILGGEVVGHNDKTGHYQSRHNRQQSGLPREKFHPFTQDPKDWYKR
jgi:hypothetical protein